jgi:hypothetical protein
MTRDDGFPIADISTALLDDPKVKALWRTLRDESRMCKAMVAYVSVLLSSWRDGQRTTVDDATPLWLEPDPELVAALQTVGLLDGDTCIPEHAWTAWYEPAFERREKRRASGRLGGLRSGETRSGGSAAATLRQRSTDAEPDRPTVRPSFEQTVRPSPLRGPIL